MKDIVKNIQTEIEKIINDDTGEILEINKKQVEILVNLDDFALIYAGMWNVILENPLSKADVELFGFLIQNYADGTPFTITRYIKAELSKKTKKSPTTYDRCTKVLLDLGLIFAVDKGRTYKINPKYAFKGSSANRNQAVIKMKSICINC
jgi:hypothetical protein